MRQINNNHLSDAKTIDLCWQLNTTLLYADNIASYYPHLIGVPFLVHGKKNLLILIHFKGFSMQCCYCQLEYLKKSQEFWKMPFRVDLFTSTRDSDPSQETSRGIPLYEQAWEPTRKTRLKQQQQQLQQQQKGRISRFPPRDWAMNLETTTIATKLTITTTTTSSSS